MLSKKDKARDKYLQRTYGITLAQYNQLLSSQNDSCGICGKHKSFEGRNLAVDHDHVTLEIRGLLCWLCNRRLIGKHRDPDLFQSAANYLRQGTGLYAPRNRKRKRTKRKRSKK